MRKQVMGLGGSLLISAGMIAGTAGVVSAQDQIDGTADVFKVSAPDNAALMYYRTWLVHESDIEKLSDLQGEEASFGSDGEPNGEFALKLDESQELVDALIRASRIEGADWGVEYDQGVYALLPHLAKLRNSARLLSYDAKRRLEKGDREGAVERTLALYRMSMQLQEDRVLISSLVGVAISSLGTNTANYLVERSDLTPDQRDRLLAQIDTMTEGDAFGIRQSVLGEKEIFLGWFEKQMMQSDAKDRLRELRSLFDGDGTIMFQLASLNREFMMNDIEKAKRYYDEALEVWDETDAVERLEELAGLVDTGEFGTTAQFLAPSLTKIKSSELRMFDDLAKTRAAVASEGEDAQR